MKIVNKIALILCILGGVNWGSIGFFQFDVVAWIFGGQDSMPSRIIYVLIGVAAIWCISFITHDDIKETPQQEQKELEVPDVGIS